MMGERLPPLRRAATTLGLRWGGGGGARTRTAPPEVEAAAAAAAAAEIAAAATFRKPRKKKTTNSTEAPRGPSVSCIPLVALSLLMLPPLASP